MRASRLACWALCALGCGAAARCPSRAAEPPIEASAEGLYLGGQERIEIPARVLLNARVRDPIAERIELRIELHRPDGSVRTHAFRYRNSIEACYGCDPVHSPRECDHRCEVRRIEDGPVELPYTFVEQTGRYTAVLVRPDTGERRSFAFEVTPFAQFTSCDDVIAELGPYRRVDCGFAALPLDSPTQFWGRSGTYDSQGCLLRVLVHNGSPDVLASFHGDDALDLDGARLRERRAGGRVHVAWASDPSIVFVDAPELGQRERDAIRELLRRFPPMGTPQWHPHGIER